MMAAAAADQINGIPRAFSAPCGPEERGQTEVLVGGLHANRAGESNICRDPFGSTAVVRRSVLYVMLS